MSIAASPNTTQSHVASIAPAAENEFIPLCEPVLAGNEWQYVRECLDSGWVSSVGSFVDRFEAETAAYLGAKHAVATVNGTAALHAALLSIGVQPDDEVLVSTLTFIASANAIRYTGAHPVLIDADPGDWQIDANLVEEFLTEACESIDGELRNRTTGRRVVAIMPVHILGHPAPIEELVALARRFGLKVVEDAAESLGAKSNGRRLGTFGDVTCLSFNGNKTITAGAGGMIVTNDSHVAGRARYLTTQAKDDAVEYVHHEIGYNYRMSNVLAALGVAQLEQLDGVIAKKRAVAHRYAIELDLPMLSWYHERPEAFSTYWLSTALIDPERSPLTALDLRERLQTAGIQTRRLWRPMHTNPPHTDCQTCLTGVADSIAENALSFPSSASLSEADQSRVCQLTRDLLLR